jgi:hypothetical protein
MTRQMKLDDARPHFLEQILTVENVEISTANDDMLIEGASWNARRIRVNFEGQPVPFLPRSDPLEKHNASFEACPSNCADTGSDKPRLERPREADQIEKAISVLDR